MISRRTFLKTSGLTLLAGATAAAYGFIIEPRYRLVTTHYAFTPPRWTPGLKLRLVLLADPHLAEPLMPVSRWQSIIATANSLQPDLMLLLGDYTTSNRFISAPVPVVEAAKAARALQAPLGVYAITGNHDWWDDTEAQRRGGGPTIAQMAFEDEGIPVLENLATPLSKDGMPFWLSGTSSDVAIRKGHSRFESRADLVGTLAQVTDDAPIIHMAHEPDLFMQMPDRVSLTLSGHTHGGQVRLFGWSPIVPSSYGNELAYGHVIKNNRHLVVSGGLGCSIAPVRFGVPPELTVVDLG